MKFEDLVEELINFFVCLTMRQSFTYRKTKINGKKWFNSHRFFGRVFK